jgi:hypothetical protein
MPQENEFLPQFGQTKDPPPVGGVRTVFMASGFGASLGGFIGIRSIVGKELPGLPGVPLRCGG